MTNATIILGAICAALGAWGIMATWPLMRQAALVALLTAMTCGGVLAVLIGLSELIDRCNRQRSARTQADPRT